MLADQIELANGSLKAAACDVVVGSESGPPRFELYNFPLSLCSQKVRATLVEKLASFRSHLVEIPAPSLESYAPEYVRLRLIGKHEGTKFVGDFTGSSDSDGEGFDPCVVPTLVDRLNERVVTDSLKICLYLDEQLSTGQQLVPESMREQVCRELKVVDQTPHVALLYSAHQGSKQVVSRAHTQPPFIYQSKLDRIEAHLAALPEGDPLRAAYLAKSKKEKAAERFVCSDEAINTVNAEMIHTLNSFEERIAASQGPWLLGDEYTLADIAWTVSLFRLKWLGMAHLYEWSPLLRQYCERAFARPSFHFACIDWPGTKRSPFVESYYT